MTARALRMAVGLAPIAAGALLSATLCILTSCVHQQPRHAPPAFQPPRERVGQAPTPKPLAKEDVAAFDPRHEPDPQAAESRPSDAWMQPIAVGPAEWPKASEMTDGDLARSMREAQRHGPYSRFRELRHEYAFRQEEWTREQRSAVSGSRVIVGMTRAQVRLAWGYPDDTETLVDANGKTETWYYFGEDDARSKTRVVHFTDGVVSAIQK